MVWKTIAVNNWSKFNDVVEKLKPKEWIFRGRSNMDWKLETSYYRAVNTIKEIKKSAGEKIYNRDTYEREIINLFKSQYYLYLSYSPENNIDFIDELMKSHVVRNSTERQLEWLSIMQH
jgi:hypothetical protein